MIGRGGLGIVLAAFDTRREALSHDAADIIERRSGSTQVRLGVGRFTIERI